MITPTFPKGYQNTLTHFLWKEQNPKIKLEINTKCKNEPHWQNTSVNIGKLVEMISQHMPFFSSLCEQDASENETRYKKH